MLTDELLGQLVATIEQHVSPIALWLFGSEAEGRARPDSDVDLGLLAQECVAIETLLSLREDLREVLKRDVDLVDLRAASPIVAHQVLIHGRLFLERDKAALAQYMVFHNTAYADVQILRRPHEAALRARFHG